jgi:inner membrane protein involved in colicin E2 resistance
MTRNVLAIIFIFLCTALGWFVLGATIMNRTYSADSGLKERVESSWGGPQRQVPPEAVTSRIVLKRIQEKVDGKVTEKTVEEPVATVLPLERSRVTADLDLEQRQKGLLWYATYRVAYRGDYLFRNNTAGELTTIKLTFPAPHAIYDDLVFRVNGQPVPTVAAAGAVTAAVLVPPGATVRLETGYRSQGMTTWHYSFGDNVQQVRDFVLTLKTNFDAIDFPQGTISPTAKQKTASGWQLTWKYNNLVTGYGIGMELPEKLQPGPLAGRISFFAPVSLLFFFFLIFIITTMRGIDLHPMHYFFLATSFFAFHLLLAYLVDHISIHAAFVICSAVSIFLVVSYLRIVAGNQFAYREAALAQLIYLVGFSYAFFFEGFTGLAITIGAIVSLFVVMQMTARVNWRAARTIPAEA